MSESASNRRKPSVIFTVVTATLIRNASQLETSVARELYFSFGFPYPFGTSVALSQRFLILN